MTEVGEGPGGSDGLTIEMLNHPKCCHVFEALFNKCFQLHMLPNQWRLGTILCLSQRLE